MEGRTRTWRVGLLPTSVVTHAVVGTGLRVAAFLAWSWLCWAAETCRAAGKIKEGCLGVSS